MSLSFSANQYQNAFDARRLQNSEVPKQHRPRPNSQDGFTQIIANNRGHLLPGVDKSSANPWGNFVGTWDIPHKIPGNCATVKTSRNTYSQEKIQSETKEANKVLGGTVKNDKRLTAKGLKPIAPTGLQTSPDRNGAKMPTPNEAAEHDKKKTSPCATPTKTPTPTKAPTPKPPSPCQDRAPSGVW